MVVVVGPVVAQESHLLVAQLQLLLQQPGPAQCVGGAETLDDEHGTEQVHRVGLAGLVEHERGERLRADVLGCALDLLERPAHRHVVLLEHPEVPVLLGGVMDGRTAQLEQVDREVGRSAGDPSPTLDHLGLVAALSSLVADVSEESDLRADLHVGGDPVRLDADIELGAFRIIQEAVRNALRHAGARRLQVTVEFAVGELRLTVTDDGRGFTPGDLDDSGATHLGLLGMRERARLLGGHLEVRSAPGAGTAVLAQVPRCSAPQDSATAQTRSVARET